MRPDQNIIIKKICFDIFEQLAFMFGEELDKEEVQCDEDRFIKAVLSFSGFQMGEIDIIVPRQLAPALAVNIMGLEEAGIIDTDTAEDALKELLNTLTGRLLPALFTDETIFNLHPPQTSEINKEQWQKLLEQEDTIIFGIEDSAVLVNVHLKK
jgi:CheY-specific phosphatase CheX